MGLVEDVSGADGRAALITMRDRIADALDSGSLTVPEEVALRRQLIDVMTRLGQIAPAPSVVSGAARPRTGATKFGYATTEQAAPEASPIDEISAARSRRRSAAPGS